MAMAFTAPAGTFKVACRHCERHMLARPDWIGREVECPFCHNVQKIPQPAASGAMTPKAESPTLAPSRAFNFPCPRCDCLLEAHTGMSRQLGRCPTCGARFTVPHVHPRSGHPHPAALVELDEDHPTPLHAYGASGEQAPEILRGPNGRPYIVCPGCRTNNPIEADRCVSCSTPFTLEAAPTARRSRDAASSSAAITFGVIGLLLFFTLLPSLLAIVFGIRGLSAGVSSAGLGSLIGAGLGVLGVIGGVIFWLNL